MSKTSTPVQPAPLPTVASESLHIEALEAQMGFLKGEILTIVDASFSDTVQRKAVKDLVHDRFRSRVDWMREVCGEK